MHATSQVHNQELKQIHRDLQREQRQIMIRRFLTNRLLMTGSVILLIVLLVALVAPFFLKHDAYTFDPMERLLSPSAEHLFGTDTFGRDLFARVVYGLQVSLKVGFFVALSSALIGLIVGLYAAYYRVLDHVLMRLCDGLMAFPGILLAIAIVGIFEPSTTNVIAALTVVCFPSVARIVRSAALVVREQTFIEALKSLGASSFRTIWLHIAPNTLSALIVQVTFIFALSITTEAALSFLGVGVPAPAPSLGNILYDGKTVIYNAWWMTVFPGATLIMVVFGLNLFGDGVRDLLDPKGSK